ncbi:hypothetical protein C0995_016452 [Termitomyces sp. Mi166|nr:hypothetical protein C0995_016452 [Termitomyces sp. Mi166\
MASDLDVSFVHQISSLETDLLSLDRSSLDDFNDRWTTLANDLKTAIGAEQLSTSTIKAAHVLSTRVLRVIQTFHDLEILAEKLMSSLLDDATITVDSSLTSSPADPSMPSYIKPSYDWLLEHIHNPYPSTQVRDTVARKSGATRKDVDNWFIDARKRIGWNEARKKHFFNKRADIVDAATRFYANDEKLSLSQGAEHALISIMKNAKDLYSDKFGETILASKLVAVVKDLTPETKAKAKTERLRQAQLKKDRGSYPSPDRSPEPLYRLPVSCNDEVDVIATQPISITSRKRRNLSVEPVELERNRESRQAKRLRLETLIPSSESVTLPTGLPSPTPSVDESLRATEPTEPIEPPSLLSFSPALASRKRRLSESDSQGVPKRPHHLPVGPRLQTVSGPVPLSNNLLSDETSFDDWFQQIFDRPEVGEISPSSVSVELGSLPEFNSQTHLEPRSSSSPENPIQIATFEPPILEVADIPPVLDVPWNEFDFGWTDNLSSENPKQLNSLLNFVRQGPLPQPLAQDLVNFQVSSQVSSLANEFESFFGPSIVDPVIINPVSNKSWDFSQFSVNRDDANIFGKHSGDFASNNGLLESFDFSSGSDFLSSCDAISLPAPSQDKVRQEKEKEFREAYEKAQRLALELQKDDLFAL